MYTPADLSKLLYPCYEEELTGGLEIREKVVVNLLHAVNSQTINAVFRNKCLDPSIPYVLHVLVFSSQIGKRNSVRTHPAVFNATCIVVIN